uniref:Rho guanine nucleotide exchange factor 18 n=1 Tax=Toxocara canis TaxID=6265 RepID=A0A183UR96_TOXCA
LSASSDMHLVSWTSQDDEREVDRIIAEMQGYSNAGIVNDEEAALWGGDESEDEEEALRRAAIVSAQKNKRQQHLVRRTNSHGDAKKSFYEFGHCSNLTQQTDDLCRLQYFYNRRDSISRVNGCLLLAERSFLQHCNNVCFTSFTQDILESTAARCARKPGTRKDSAKLSDDVQEPVAIQTKVLTVQQPDEHAQTQFSLSQGSIALTNDDASLSSQWTINQSSVYRSCGNVPSIWSGEGVIKVDMGSRRSSKSGVEPLLVTVTNESANEHNVLPTTQDVSESQLASSKEYDEALHNIRMCFEQNATLTTVNREQEGDLGDNYEQVGMDIVDSDLDSQSRSGAPRIMPVEGDMMNGNTVPADEPSLDDEAERLRAALLEQYFHIFKVKRKKHLEERADISMNSREEGEISGGSSPTPSPDVAHKIVTANLSAVVNCDDYSAGLHATLVVCCDREECEQRCPVNGYKRRAVCRKIRSSARNGDQHIASVDRLQSLERSVEEWESLIEEERKEKELIESKMRHKDVQRSTNASKRDRYLVRLFMLIA